LSRPLRDRILCPPPGGRDDRWPPSGGAAVVCTATPGLRHGSRSRKATKVPPLPDLDSDLGVPVWYRPGPRQLEVFPSPEAMGGHVPDEVVDAARQAVGQQPVEVLDI